MSEEKTEEEVEQEKTEEPHGSEEDRKEPPADTTDWKAEARKWEARAKENKSAARELEEARAKAEKAEQELNELKSATEREHVRAKVAKEAGVPADLVAGDTEEEMRDWATRLAERLRPKGAPKVPVNGKFAETEEQSDKRKFARELFGGGQ
jgi:hypothetical protein